jgi:methionyl-tRNA synthetase
MIAGIPFGEDGLFTPETFIETINTSLVNDFGNLLNRTIGMISKYFGGDIPAYKGDVTAFDKAFRTYGEACINEYEANMDKFKVDAGIKSAIEYITRANKYIEETTPWALAKDESRKEELASIMNHLVACLRQTAIMLSPVLLKAPTVLFDALDIPSEFRTYESLRNFGGISGGKVSKIAPLFPRIDASVDTEVIKELMK